MGSSLAPQRCLEPHSQNIFFTLLKDNSHGKINPFSLDGPCHYKGLFKRLTKWPDRNKHYREEIKNPQNVNSLCKLKLRKILSSSSSKRNHHINTDARCKTQFRSLTFRTIMEHMCLNKSTKHVNMLRQETSADVCMPEDSIL